MTNAINVCPPRCRHTSTLQKNMARKGSFLLDRSFQFTILVNDPSSAGHCPKNLLPPCFLEMLSTKEVLPTKCTEEVSSRYIAPVGRHDRSLGVQPLPEVDTERAGMRIALLSALSACLYGCCFTSLFSFQLHDKPLSNVSTLFSQGVYVLPVLVARRDPHSQWLSTSIELRLRKLSGFLLVNICTGQSDQVPSPTSWHAVGLELAKSTFSVRVRVNPLLIDRRHR